MLGVYSLYAGRALSLDREVYESERTTGHRNRAIGHMLQNFEVLTAAEVFLLMSGAVSVVVEIPNAPPRRLATVSAGMMFGELAVINRAARSADVRADQPVECRVLSAADFDRLGETHPQIKVALLQNMLRSAHQMVSRLNLEVATLASAT